MYAPDPNSSHAAAAAYGDVALVGDLGRDRALVSHRLQEFDHVVDTLPPRAERSPDEHRLADATHHAARLLRTRFLAAYAEDLYAELTNCYTETLSLAQIADRAAEYVPGVVPTQARLAAESRLPQAAKEGWEIDQSLLFGALLGSPTAGTHLLRAALRPTPRALALLPDYRRTGHADLGTATVQRRDGVARLELRNDRYLNAEDDATVEALETGTDLVLLDDASHVGVLRGAPMTRGAYRGRRVFSAGINLTDLYHGRISLVGFMLRREVGYIAKFLHGLCFEPDEQPGKPWIGAVDTFAIGGGMQVLAVLDRVVAADDAWFSLPAMQEGLVPGLANLRLPRLLGGRLARDLIFWGRRLVAGEPAARLVCDEVVPADGLGDAVDRAAAHLDNPAVAANRRMLTLSEEPLDVFRCYLSHYAREQSYRMYSRDLIANLERTWIERDRGNHP